MTSPVRGVLPVHKPAGISSFDVVRRIHRELKPGKVGGRVTGIGHAGTLDPMASGVLLVLVGEATRLARFLMTLAKEYEAEVTFGLSTDTDDITGQPLVRCPVQDVSPAQLQVVLTRFVGTIEQVPPSFSALKQDGQPLYRLARSGQPVEPKPRRVTVHTLELLGWDPPKARLRCLVSSGTYVRALARDLGSALGSAATLSQLVRTRVGSFRLDDAVPFEAISLDTIGGRIVPIEKAVPDVCLLTVDEPDGTALRAGRAVFCEQAAAMNGPALARTSLGTALYLVRVEKGRLHPERLVYDDGK